MIGTQFEEEEISKKQNIYNQITRDDKGHKRFHGAFTGGFQAGYKNTCGSEQGFQPKTFISSRNNRAQVSQQNVTDIMDEDDLGNQVIGENIITREEFSNLGFSNNDAIANSLGLAQQGQKMVEKQQSIGQKILENLKKHTKKEKKDKYENLTDEQIFQLAMQEEEDQQGGQLQQKDYFQQNYEQMIRGFSKKQDFSGIGYDGLNSGGGIDFEMENIFMKMVAKKNFTTVEEQENIRKESNRVYVDNMMMKKGIQDDDMDENEYDDDYVQYGAKKNISYDTHDQSGMSIEQQQQQKDNRGQMYREYSRSQGKLKDQFTQDFQNKSQQDLNNEVEQIQVPENYDIYHKIKEYNSQKQGQKVNQPQLWNKNNRMNPSKRSALLGEQSRMEQFQERIQTKEFVKGETQDMNKQKENQDNELYFKNDAQKQHRFEQFQLEREGKIIGGTGSEGLSWDQIQEERKEFEKLCKEQEKQKKKQEKLLFDGKDIKEKIRELEDKVEKLQNVRESEKFYPEKLLCKRFGCLPPYKNQEYYEQQVEMEKKKQIKMQNKQKEIRFEKRETIVSEVDNEQNMQKMMQQFGLPQEFKTNKGLEVINDSDSYDSDIEKVRENKEKQEQKDQMDLQKQIQIKESEEMNKPKQPISVYQAIFNDDDSDSDSDDSSEN